MDGFNRQARIRLHAAFSEEFRRIPLESSDGIIYLSVPLGYRLWTQKLSKLELAADMVRSVMTELVSCRQVILLCDSWYPRKPVTGLVDAFENLEIICCARSDTVLYDPPGERTGRRGRPRIHGRRLSLWKNQKAHLII